MMTSLNIGEIFKILPHRYPFLMVDRILEITDGKIIGIKNVSVNEPFFQGHFPGEPIMPGVLIIEAMAQVGGIYAIVTQNLPTDMNTYFVGIDNAKFRKPVVPGDILRFELELLKQRRGIYFFHGEAYVENDLVAEADLKATLIPKKESEK
ncbi:MAG: 3-hydroxyacyl-ACP dehydratase FabZ [Deltaproteobacteria bacterium]|nr:3-hydroxyacyl-ACP dehydratase FabZ [Deltaproteobacteria bacterium]